MGSMAMGSGFGAPPQAQLAYQRFIWNLKGLTFTPDFVGVCNFSQQSIRAGIRWRLVQQA